MSDKQILREFFPIQYDRHQILTETAGNPAGSIILKNIVLQRANVPNQNKRIYPREILIREIEKYNNEFVKQRRAMGECDHAESAVVNLKNVSHLITEVHFEGDDVIGTVEILNTPSGNIVKELLKSGIKIGVSSRGAGSVRELGEGVVEVESDFSFITLADIVSNPSVHGAFLHENVDISLPDRKYLQIQNLVHEFLSEIG